MSNSAALWAVAHQVPLSTGSSRQEYWNGLLFPSPGDLPNPGIKPRSPALQAYSLPSEPPGKLTSTQIEHELYWQSHPLLPAEFTVTRWCRHSGSKRTSWGLTLYLWQHTRLHWEWAKLGPPCSPFSKPWILKVCHSVLLLITSPSPSACFPALLPLTMVLNILLSLESLG